MNNLELNELEIASSEVVHQAARNFAAALAGSAEFQAFEAASEKMDNDPAAQAALNAFQAKQRQIKGTQSSRPITAEEQHDFMLVRQAFLDQPSVAAYFQAQANLIAICQEAGDMLSNYTGLNFGATASSSGCC